MKFRLKARVPAAMSALVLMISADAGAVDVAPFRMGLQLGVGASPFPSLIGLAVTGDIMGLVRLHIAGDAFGFVQGFSAGNSGGFGGLKLGGSAGAKLRIPSLIVSPTVGIEYSRTTIVGTINKYFGTAENESAWFMVPSAGLEFGMHGKSYIAAGVSFPWMATGGTVDYVKIDGFYPYLNLGTSF